MEVPTTQNKLSSAQLRKIKKPIIERRRRGRINDSMNQLKALLLEAMNKDVPSHSKMEKADILELAVDYLRKVKTSVPASKPSPREAVTKYQSGYTHCAQEVSRYLSMRGAGSDLASRVKSHLSSQAVERTSSCSDTTRIPEATTFASLPGAAVPVRVLRAEPAHPTVVPLYHGGHMAQSYHGQMVRSHQVCRDSVVVAPMQDSVLRTISPRAAPEVSHVTGHRSCGLEMQTRIPGLCQEYSLVQSHADATLWRPW